MCADAQTQPEESISMRRNIEVLILALLAALSMMAVTAVGAQAEGEFRVEGKALAEGEEAELEGTGGESKLSVPSLGLTISCGSVLLKSKSKNVKIGIFKHAHAEHHVLRHFCFAAEFEETCSIYPTEADLLKGTNAGLLLSSTLRLTRLLGKISHYLTYKASERFFFGGVFCPLPEVAEITGETAVKFGNATAEATEHTMEDITAKEEKELEVKGLFFNGEPAEMSGDNTSVKLVGKFAGKKYSLN
jgi:hypothetical protein